MDIVGDPATKPASFCEYLPTEPFSDCCCGERDCNFNTDNRGDEEEEEALDIVGDTATGSGSLCEKDCLFGWEALDNGDEEQEEAMDIIGDSATGSASLGEKDCLFGSEALDNVGDDE